MEPYLSQVIKKYLYLFSTVSIVCPSKNESLEIQGVKGMFGYFFCLSRKSSLHKDPRNIINVKAVCSRNYEYVEQSMHTYDENCFQILASVLSQDTITRCCQGRS